jgi:hypothetical protein
VTGVIRIRLWVEMGRIAGSTQEDIVEIPREEWDALTEVERRERVNSEAEEFMASQVDFGGSVEDEG